MEYNYDQSIVSDPAMAQAAGTAFFGVMIVWFLFIVATYVYMAICLMKIAKKTGTENAWFAWIPILNMILMLNIAKKPIWWIIMFFIPFVNIVFSILVWMGVSEAVKKPSWLGILMIIPIANIVIPGYLAFSKTEEGPTTIIIPPAQSNV